ncbi:MAG: cytidylate kinase [Flavobacteriales bacterium CG_4_9_14_3_um_filter_40_17]|nr:MAG: cytidylate kinase [Flavobacteriales bacterium CG_4_9_14_3_um_filter_40_17]
MPDIIIAIDGHSSTGKSTLAKRLANALGYVFIDTGAMYRAVTLFAMQQGFLKNNVLDEKKLIAALPDLDLQFLFNPKKALSDMYLNRQNVSDEIRNLAVSQQVSRVATLAEVRKKLVSLQHEMGKQKRIVMDGRDIGTVVFPQAELKIFMTATPEIRAQRRFDEMKSTTPDITFEEVLENVKHRDLIDSTRKESPLRQAPDAVVIDNSNLTKDEQFESVLGMARALIG